MLGKGEAHAITDKDVSALATRLGVHPADLEAIAEVESNGFGWFKDGRIKILFEKHWFYKLLSGAQRDRAVREGLARKNWISPSNGGYKDQSNADARYRLLTKAMAINEEMALQSISMGRFQIMGFNYALCGFISAKQMWTKFLHSEVYQLEAFANFLTKKNLIAAVKNRDFDTVEEVYNGGGLNGAYARKMKTASDKLRAGKWANWQPDKPVSAPQPVPPPVLPKEPEPAPVAAPEPAQAKTGIITLIAIAASSIAAYFGWGS